MKTYEKIDRVAFIFLLLLAVNPFSNLMNFRIGFAMVNFAEICLVFVSIVMIVGGFWKNIVVTSLVVFLIFFFSFLCYVSMSVGFGAPIGEVVGHVRGYLPFFVALLFFLFPITMRFNLFVSYLAWVVALSAGVAIVCKLFFLSWISSLAVGNLDLAEMILIGGRMYWDPAPLALIAVALLLINGGYSSRLSLLTVVVIVAALFLTQNRTLIVSTLLLILAGGYIVKVNSNALFVKLLPVAIFSVVFFTFVSDDHSVALLKSRFFLGDDRADVWYHAFSQGRLVLYRQYVDVLLSSFPFGVGFGVPYAYTTNIYGQVIPLFTSDVALLAFSIPMGVVGMLLYLLFWFSLWLVLRDYRSVFRDDRVALYFIICLILIVVFVALNVDLVSRNIFVVYFVALVTLRRRSADMPAS